MSPETKAHIDRLFAGQPSAGNTPSVTPRPGGLATAVKGLPGGAVVGDLANSARKVTQGKTNLGGVENEQLARQGLGGYLTNVAQNLVTPGNSLLAYFGAGGHPEAAVGGALTGPVSRALGSNLGSAVRLNKSPGAQRSIWKALNSDAEKFTTQRGQAQTELGGIQAKLKALQQQHAGTRRDPGAAFSSQLGKNLAPALTTAAVSPVGSSLQAAMQTPSRFGRLGQLAALAAPVTSQLTAPATEALLNAGQRNRMLAPLREALAKQMPPLEQSAKATTSKIQDLTKMLARVRARQQDYSLSPLTRAWRNTANMFSPQNQTSY